MYEEAFAESDGTGFPAADYEWYAAQLAGEHPVCLEAGAAGLQADGPACELEAEPWCARRHSPP